MRSPALALACVGLVLPALAGCGSSSASPFTVACTTHRLPGGLVRASLTVTNTSGTPSRVIIYGPALERVTHIYPLLRSTYVVVTASGRQQAYPGFIVPRITPKRPAHVLLRLAGLQRSATIVATNTQTVHATSLANSSCTIQRG